MKQTLETDAQRLRACLNRPKMPKEMIILAEAGSGKAFFAKKEVVAKK